MKEGSAPFYYLFAFCCQEFAGASGMKDYNEGRDFMITAELTQKIDTLSQDEYRMVEVYVDNVLEYSKRRKKEAAWERIQSDLKESENRMRLEGGIPSKQLRENLGV